MLFEKVIEQFRARSLTVELPEATLLQGTTTDRICISGSCVISQDSSGQLKLVFLPQSGLPRPGPYNPFDPLRPLINPGELLPRKSYYRLQGTDQWGDSWRTNWLVPHSVGRQPVIRADVRELARYERFPYTPEIELEAFDAIDVPVQAATTIETIDFDGGKSSESRLDGAVVDARGLKLRFTKREKSLRCRVSVTSRLPYRFRHRLTEALQFVLARKINWSTEIRRRRGVQILRLWPSYGPTVSTRSRFQPPIQFHIVDGTRCVWPLFVKYFEYICSFRGRQWHPTSEQVYSVIEASEGSLYAEALSLAVAAEGITVAAFSNLMHRPDGLRKAVNSLEAHVLSWPDLATLGSENEITPDRIRGLLGLLLNPNVNAIFRKLIERGFLTQQSVAAWKRVRHPRAHGKVTSSVALQDLIRDIDAVTTMFYQIIFAAIGYSGKFTDYSTLGWPTREFPLAETGTCNDARDTNNAVADAAVTNAATPAAAQSSANTRRKNTKRKNSNRKNTKGKDTKRKNSKRKNSKRKRGNAKGKFKKEIQERHS